VNKEAAGYGRSSIYSLGKTTDINFWSRDINNKGEVVGFFYLYSGGQTIELPHSYEGTMYTSINEHTQIVGSWSGFIGVHAVILENKVDWTHLSPSLFGEALDINNNEQIIGYFLSSGNFFACLWEKDSQNKWVVRQLDTVKSTAWAINDNGQVVGCSNIAPLNDLLPENADATLYQNGKKINLNDFLPESSEFERLICALDINNKGQIVGYGEGRNEPGSQYAFVMTPIPQPSADLYEDGIVDFKDLAEFASQWLESNQR
jgi:probable HAF family extracellular repeat protein